MVKIVLTGLNGYGGHFIVPLLESDGTYQLSAVVSTNPKKSPYYEKLKEEKVRFYNSLEDCLQEEKLDMALITTPVQVHFREVMCALEHGLNVYCEKPLAPKAEHCRQVQECAAKRGLYAAVGFQWSHSKAVTDLKNDILTGKYGKLKKIKTMALWNRPKSYYTESNWKGRYWGKDKESIWESVISNAAVHFLHNLLFLAGGEMAESATPVHISGEAYRAHKIETFDTACMKMKTEEDCQLFYLATLSAKQNHAPEFTVECENARIFYPVGDEKEIMAVKKESGERIFYGSPDAGRFEHFKKVIRAMEGNEPLTCDAGTVLPVAGVIDQMMENVEVHSFPEEAVRENGDMLWVEGLEEFMKKCYEEEKMFAEAD